MCAIVSDELAYRIAFSFVSGIGPARMRGLEARYESLEAAWQGEPDGWREAGLDAAAIEHLQSTRAEIRPAEERTRLEEKGVQAISWHDERYPKRLTQIADPPPLLFVYGELADRDEWSIAVVGTRRPSPYGRQVTQKFSADLVDAGLTIVSGLAYGVDGLAHETALERNGRTLAVVAGGLDKLYPREHRNLAARIVDSGSGAVLSEYPLGVRPKPDNFPRRNRILAGMTLGTLVTEAGLKSGTWHTVNSALDQGREVFAVPGAITSQQSEGTNQIIQQGHGKLVTSAGDVLEELQIEEVERQIELSEQLPEDPTQAAVLGVLSAEPLHVDQASRAAAMPASEVSAALAMLELKGMVRQVGPMLYVRS